MNGNRYSCVMIMSLGFAALFGANSLIADSGIWNGTENTFWTNSNNWSASPYAGSTAGEVATFNNNGVGNVLIDLIGLGSIRSVIFDDAAVVPYTLGTGAANSQVLVLEDDGNIQMQDDAGSSQTINASIQLGPDTTSANYNIRNYSATQTLTVNNISGTTGGSKYVNFIGSGDINVLGDIANNGSGVYVSNSSTGDLTLNGSNTVRQLTVSGVDSVTTLSSGSSITFNSGGGNNIVGNQDATINGPGSIYLSTGGGENYADNYVYNGRTLTINAKLTGATGFEYWNSSQAGTFILAGVNDYTLNTIMNSPGTIACYTIGNKGSLTSNLGQGTFFRLNGEGARLKYLGTGETTDRQIQVNRNGRIEMAGTGTLKFTDPLIVSGGTKSLTLEGSTSGIGEFAGIIQNSSGLINLVKEGSGRWLLTTNNTYTGYTAVNNGTLVLAGAHGSIKTTSYIALGSGSTLMITNSASANNGDRLSDSNTIYMRGGTLKFGNDAGAANFSETVGTVQLDPDTSSTISCDQAAPGQSSTLTLSSVVTRGGTINFTGTGLGVDTRNRILISDQSEGLIGTWATVNGTGLAAYSSTLGVYALSSITTNEIAARGPTSVIPDDGSALTHITTAGTDGPVTMAGDWTNRTFQLLQNVAESATVETRIGTTNKTLMVANLDIAENMYALTIGEAPGHGYLAALYDGGDLLINNQSDSNLTVNATVVDNGSASSLTKWGPGTVQLNGGAFYSGPTTLEEGELIIDGSSVAPGPGQSLKSGIKIYDGKMLLNDVNNYVADQNCYIGLESGDFGELTLSGDSYLLGNVPAGSTTGTQAIRVGDYGKGILKIEDNTVISNKLMVGVNGGSVGAVYQTGGSFNDIGAQSNDGRIGFYGYGYYELSGGYYKQWGYCQAGIEPNSVGIFSLKGGTFESGNSPSGYDGNFGLSRGGNGILHQTGGLFTTPEYLEIGDEYDNNTTDGYAEYTIEGGEAVIGGGLYMAGRNNMFAALNLNGGIVSGGGIWRDSGRIGNEAYVNFDGGTYRELDGGEVISGGSSAPDAVNIFDGGAVIDTLDNACSMPAPLLAPEGNGVSAIQITPAGGYIGPPLVRISGGGGAGATAVANFDSASGMVTGITVTSPGFGYTSSPTVTLSGGGASSQASVDNVVLSANASGGLTKMGSGTLTLSATNTYTGITVVSNGVLKLGVAEALPAANEISLNGGTYNLGGFAVTNDTVSVTDGTLLNGTLHSDNPVVVDGGLLKFIPQLPGLYEGSVAGSFNVSDANPETEVELGTLMADTYSTDVGSGGWPENTTFIYTGYIWNRDPTNVTWTFAENFDDRVQLVIDSTTVLNGGISWNVPTIGTIELAPGSHFFEARFGQGGGGAGPVNSEWWKTRDFGFGVDFLGRNDTNINNYVALRDPGDGSLLSTLTTGFTNIMSADTTVQLANDATLDLGGSVQFLDTLSGSGTVSNGTLIVTDTLAPGGQDNIGTLSISTSLSLNGTLLVDVDPNGSSDLLEVDGDLDLTSATLTVADSTELKTSEQYTVATATGTVTLPFADIVTDDNSWDVKLKPGGNVKLVYLGGTLIIIR